MVLRTGEMAQWLRVFIGISKRLVSALNTNIVVHNHQTVVQAVQDPVLSYIGTK